MGNDPAPVKSQYLDFHGIAVALEALDAPAESALESLRHDFEYFARPAKPGSAPVGLRLVLQGTPRPVPPKTGPRLFRTRMCDVYGAGDPRLCDYGTGSWVLSAKDGGERRIEIHGASEEELYEIAYTALLSAAGEALDRQGFHRIHALAFQDRGRSYLVVLPQGGGKSALGALLLARPEARLFSDEIPLLHEGVLHPFPIRMALHEEVSHAVGWGQLPSRPFRRRIFPTKLLYPIPPDRVAVAGRPDVVLVGKILGRGTPRIRRASRLRTFASLLSPLVVGIGVPQMAEFLLRADSLAALAGVGFSRLGAALGLARSCSCRVFELGRDARANSAVLQEFLDAAPPLER